MDYYESKQWPLYWGIPGSGWIFSAGLEFLIRAAGCLHWWLSSGLAWNPSRAPSRASVKYPITNQGCFLIFETIIQGCYYGVYN